MLQAQIVSVKQSKMLSRCRHTTCRRLSFLQGKAFPAGQVPLKTLCDYYLRAEQWPPCTNNNGDHPVVKQLHELLQNIFLHSELNKREWHVITHTFNFSSTESTVAVISGFWVCAKAFASVIFLRSAAFDTASSAIPSYEQKYREWHSGSTRYSIK